MNWDDLTQLSGVVGRIKTDEAGKPSLRYRATDPALKQTICTCGRTDCLTELVLPLRAHVASLMKGLVGIGIAGLVPGGAYAWPGVLYDLQLAGSLEDLFADPSFADESDAWAWCAPAWQADEEHREAASKYLAATVIFNFVWSAYESAVHELPVPRKPKDTVAVHGRKLLDVPEIARADVPVFGGIYQSTYRFCRRLPELQEKLDESRTQFHSLATKSAELARLFRNHMVHGADPRPETIIEGEQACRRIYAVTRLTLILIQLLVLRATNFSNYVIEHSMKSGTVVSAERALRNLHMRYEAWNT